MRAFIKKLIKQALPYTEAVHKLLSCYSLRFYLEEIGWFRSVVERFAVDRDGNSLPWFTYPAIFFLSSKIKPEMVVFEYGSGTQLCGGASKYLVLLHMNTILSGTIP